jgi:3-hydroxyacyl-[acyl-carrier-protein] dehydratase
MPPPILLDPATLDLSNPVADRAAIMRLNPQRDEFALLDAVVLCDQQRGLFAGYHDVRADAYWARGHVPGRPLFPGVLMIEVAGQLSSFVCRHVSGGEHFIGLGALDTVRFRGTVEPPCRFIVIGQATKWHRRRTQCMTQGFVNGIMVFEAVITGLAV